MTHGRSQKSLEQPLQEPHVSVKLSIYNSTVRKTLSKNVILLCSVWLLLILSEKSNKLCAAFGFYVYFSTWLLTQHLTICDHLLITVMSSICSQILTKNPGYSHTLTNSHTILTSSGATVVINKLEYVNSSLAENEKVF